MRYSFALCALGLSVLAAAGLATAQVPDTVAQVDLRPGWRADNGTHMAAIEITLAPGWKTYWRSPGDGGIPPRLMLTPSDNIRSVQIGWPVPEVFDQNGLRSIGYTDGVTLPLAIATIDSGGPIDVSGRIEIGVCEDVCIPMSFPINARLDSEGLEDPVVRAAFANRPKSANEAGVRSISCRVEPIADGLRVTARIALGPLPGTETAVFETNLPDVWVAPAEVSRSGNMLEATTEMVPANAKPFALDRSKLRITVIGTDQAVDIRGC